MASTTTPPRDDIARRIYVGTITTIVPATIVVILRYIARYLARAGLWWDDHTIAQCWRVQRVRSWEASWEIPILG